MGAEKALETAIYSIWPRSVGQLLSVARLMFIEM